MTLRYTLACSLFLSLTSLYAYEHNLESGCVQIVCTPDENLNAPSSLMLCAGSCFLSLVSCINVASPDIEYQACGIFCGSLSTCGAVKATRDLGRQCWLRYNAQQPTLPPIPHYPVGWDPAQ